MVVIRLHLVQQQLVVVAVVRITKLMAQTAVLVVVLVIKFHMVAALYREIPMG
jgi:hypothetical protein